MYTPLPSRLGPCADFRLARRSKFCAVCGHTVGGYERPSVEIPRRERLAARPLFEAVGGLVYDSATQTLRRIR